MERGSLGQDLVVLLYEDPKRAWKMEQASLLALEKDSVEVADIALYLALYFAKDQAKVTLDEMIRLAPRILTCQVLRSFLNILSYRNRWTFFKVVC